MDSRGQIYDEAMVARLDEEQRKKLTPVPTGLEGVLRGMNRKERRAWLAVHRREQRKAGAVKP